MSFRRIYKRKSVFYTLLTLLVVVWFLALALPVGVRAYLNHYVLNDMGVYQGRVGDIDLRWFKGAYALNDLRVTKVSSEKDVPFFQVDEFLIYASLPAILQGDLSFSARLKSPQLNFMDSGREDDRQTGEGGSWLKTFESIVPDRLDRIDVENGKLAFKNLDSSPKVDIQADNLEISAKNLTNRRNREGKNVATATLKGRVLDHGNLDVNVDFDPTNFENFDFKLKATDIDLSSLNDLSRVYANLDFRKGHGEIYSEISAIDGDIDGYIKPMFTDVDILSWKQDVESQDDGPVQVVWEGLVGTFKTLFTNFSTEKIATEIELDGSIKKPDISPMQAFMGVVKNSFGSALESGFSSENEGASSNESEAPEEKRITTSDEVAETND